MQGQSQVAKMVIVMSLKVEGFNTLGFLLMKSTWYQGT